MHISRRDWMLASVCWSELIAARLTRGAETLRILTPSEARELRALTNAILPDTGTPGAEQAGTVEFINAALAGYDRDQIDLYRQGLADLSRQRFSTLPPSQQTAILKSIEKTAFFDKVRTHTVLAYFGNPELGWKLLGRDPAMHFEPPFGYYDAEVKSR